MREAEQKSQEQRYWYDVQRENPHDGTDAEMDGNADRIRAIQEVDKVTDPGSIIIDGEVIFDPVESGTKFTMI